MILPLFLPPIGLLPLLAIGGSLLVKIVIGILEPSDACSIAIFGSKGAGKSTLWQQLQKSFSDNNYHTTLGVEDVNEFSINYNGKTKRISKSKDFGGDDNLVKEYGNIIFPGTFIYYLINLTTLQQYKKETRARIQAISKVIENKGLKEHVGFRLVATHYNEYLIRHPESGLAGARADLINTIGIKDIKDVNIEESVMVAELTDIKDINQFFEQIVK